MAKNGIIPTCRDDKQSLLTNHEARSPYRGVGRGCGVGRGLGVALGVAVGVGVVVAVAVGVGVGVGSPVVDSMLRNTAPPAVPAKAYPPESIANAQTAPPGGSSPLLMSLQFSASFIERKAPPSVPAKI